MFLKLTYGSNVKKVVFREEFRDFEGFMRFIELVTKKNRSELVVSTVDKEGEKVPISDQYELDYFVEQTKNDPMSMALIENAFGSDSQAAFAESRIDPFLAEGEDPWAKLVALVQENLRPLKDVLVVNKKLEDPLFRKKSEVSVATSPQPERVRESFPVEKKSVGVSPGSQKNSLTVVPDAKDRKESGTGIAAGVQVKEAVANNSFEAQVAAPKPEINRSSNSGQAKVPPPKDDSPLMRQIPDFKDEREAGKPPVSSQSNPVQEKNNVFEANILKRLESLEKSYDFANQGFLEATQGQSSALPARILPEFKKPVHKVTEIHNGVTCDLCHGPNIQGKRYKCLVCPNFDLCENCEAKNNHLHPMVRIMAHVTTDWETLTKKFNKIQARVSRKKSEHATDFESKMDFLTAVFPNDKRKQEKYFKKFATMTFDDFKRQILAEVNPYPVL